MPSPLRIPWIHRGWTRAAGSAMDQSRQHLGGKDHLRSQETGMLWRYRTKRVGLGSERRRGRVGKGPRHGWANEQSSELENGMSVFWPSIDNNFLHNLGKEDSFLCVSVFGFYLSTYSFIFGCAGSFFAACRLSLVVVSRSFSIVMLHRLLMLQSISSRVQGLRSCSPWAQ